MLLFALDLQAEKLIACKLALWFLHCVNRYEVKLTSTALTCTLHILNPEQAAFECQVLAPLLLTYQFCDAILLSVQHSESLLNIATTVSRMPVLSMHNFNSNT
jgi:hypothetical protein